MSTEIVWRPQPKQAEFLRRPEPEVLYGGAAGGGDAVQADPDELRGGALRHAADGVFGWLRRGAAPVHRHRLGGRHPRLVARLALLHPLPLRGLRPAGLILWYNRAYLSFLKEQA